MSLNAGKEHVTANSSATANIFDFQANLVKGEVEEDEEHIPVLSKYADEDEIPIVATTSVVQADEDTVSTVFVLLFIIINHVNIFLRNDYL